MSYKIAFIAYASIASINLFLVITELKEKPTHVVIVRLISEVILHFVVAYSYFSEWRKSKLENKE